MSDQAKITLRDSLGHAGMNAEINVYGAQQT
jgi:hypothetical protein